MDVLDTRHIQHHVSYISEQPQAGSVRGKLNGFVRGTAGQLHRVAPGGAFHLIRAIARSPEERVVAGLTEQGVSSRTAGDPIVPAEAANRVVAAETQDRVIAGSSDNDVVTLRPNDLTGSGGNDRSRQTITGRRSLAADSWREQQCGEPRRGTDDKSG
jgi:hypothetical protein